MMVIGSFVPLKIGEVRKGLRDSMGVFHPQPYLVMAVATAQEWEDYTRNAGGEPTPESSRLGALYYKIHTD